MARRAETAELVSDAEIAGLTPEICEPPPYDGLVVFFLDVVRGLATLEG
jgi:hypothetical protein